VIVEDSDPPVLALQTTAGLILEFEKTYPYGPDDAYVSGLVVRATGRLVHIEQQAILSRGTDLPAFLLDLYDDFRGWDGDRTWRSLEDELRISARHDGHVHLRWELRHRPYTSDSSWTFSVTTEHGPGEDVRRLADAFHGLLREPDDGA